MRILDVLPKLLINRSYIEGIAAGLPIAPATPIATAKGHDIAHFDRVLRIVALDDQLTALGFTTGPVLDHHVQAASWVQGCRERIVDEPEMPALTAKADFEHAQLAVAYVANGDGLLGDTAADFAEVRRARESELACGHVAPCLDAAGHRKHGVRSVRRHSNR
jgi:hypothetical protein